MTRPESEDYMARCAGVRARVYEFLDAELAASDRERVDAHLSACPPCAGFFAHERAFLEVIERRRAVEEAPAELRDRIRAALTQREETRRRR
jgi:mycothiol system anti-sigma-R factor